MIEQNKNYLITTDGWFFGADGEAYRAVWGKCKIVKTIDAMGFEPERSTNWYVQVGEGEGSIIVAGCQLHYAIQTKDPQ